MTRPIMNYFSTHHKTDAEIQKEARDKAFAEFYQYAASDDCPPGQDCPRASKNDDVWACVKCIIGYLRNKGDQK